MTPTPYQIRLIDFAIDESSNMMYTISSPAISQANYIGSSGMYGLVMLEKFSVSAGGIVEQTNYYSWSRVFDENFVGGVDSFDSMTYYNAKLYIICGYMDS